MAGPSGLFAVYKPPGVAWGRVRDALETRLLRELNAAPGRPPRHHVRFLPAPAGAPGLVAARVPLLADHPLVLGLGHGNRLLTDWYNCHLTRVYTVDGLFGKATDDFSDTGKLVEKTTFDHITREKLERILAVIQGTNHKALVMHSHIDMKTQEAYELAIKGLIRPMGKSPPIITAVRCLQFAPPEFQLEMHCLHETQQYLRRIVHEIGLELKSCAVCTQVRRIRDGVFTLDDALLRSQWNLQSIQNAIWNCQLKVTTELEKTLGHQSKSHLHKLDVDMAHAADS
ncbi:pseudouridylate synthase TRUB2, mitochondrial isoform X2 [Falco biarmicus]|uniref:pseudouridylate synthase TRUB2, mitochondrial isoform X2 n=1 Tax=Falco cherrug TaxID=345164 RepID=UPI002479C204|nr:pseudouridylate synthase TRUB2, mitochondrial isoform X2 [Falco cherrug]XP_055649957.1 pseudouridylate synthase TRUB2, mitochondrial isoform X2 [Falco peregrinus]XP_056206872.1 pseudouridylate synthase TRUB2, mitochondrial isoform X2 [Falco biarmicus]